MVVNAKYNNIAVVKAYHLTPQLNWPFYKNATVQSRSRWSFPSYSLRMHHHFVNMKYIFLAIHNTLRYAAYSLRTRMRIPDIRYQLCQTWINGLKLIRNTPEASGTLSNHWKQSQNISWTYSRPQITQKSIKTMNLTQFQPNELPTSKIHAETHQTNPEWPLFFACKSQIT